LIQAPVFIQEALARGEFSGSFPAAALKADIIGFTARFMDMASGGSRGAEALSVTVSRTLSRAVEIASKRGGVPVSFAGDAVTMVFRNDPGAAKAVALEIEKAHLEHPEVLPMRAHASRGIVEWDCLSMDGWVFSGFQGSALGMKGDRTGDQLRRAQDVSTVRMEPVKSPHFLSPDLFPGEITSEFRHVRSVFISLENRRRRGCPRTFQQLVLDAAEETGGFVSGLEAGDEGYRLLAVFGAPVSREDDPRRTDTFLRRVFASAQGRVRAGASSGIVFSGMVRTPLLDAYTVLGPSVNLAARLHDTAAWNSVACDPHFGGSSEMEERGGKEARLKGFPGTVPYTVLSPWRKRRGASVSRPPLLERGDVLDEIGVMLAVPCSTVLVTGETGIGKTRVLQEASGRSGGFFMTMRCRSLNESGTDIFSSWLGEWTGEGDLPSFREKLYDLIDRVEDSLSPDSDEVADELLRAESVLAAMVGLNWEGSLYGGLEPGARFANTVSVLAALVRAMMILGGRVMAVDDLQWIDPDSRRLLREVLQELGEDGPSLLLLTSESGGGDEWNPEAEITLGPISRSGVEEYLKWSLGEAPSRELVNWFYRRTEGNPFFMEQYAGMLESPAAPPDEDSFPGSLHSLLVARLDRLDPGLKRTVLAASILGREFTVGILERLCGEDELRASVESGIRKGIWHTPSAGVCSFTHNLLREAAYRLQPHSERTALHNSAALVMEGLWEGLPEKSAVIARQHEMAGNGESASSFYMDAGRYSLSRRMNGSCRVQMDKVLELSGDPRMRLAARKILFELSVSSGEMDQAQSEIDLCAGESGLDKAGEAEILMMRVDLAVHRGQPETIQELLEETEKLNPALRHRIMHLRGRLLMLQGRTAEARDHMYSLYREFRNGTEEERLTAHKALGNAAGSTLRLGDDLEGAEEGFRTVLDYARETGNLLMETLCVGNLALTYKYMPRRMDDALRMTREHLELARRTGSRLVEMQALGNLASILEREAPSEEAFRMYEEALKRAEKYGGNDSVAIAHANLAGAHSRKGDLEEAVSHYREAVGICRSEKMGLYLIDFLLELGCTLAEAGRIDAARDILDEINEAEPASDYAVAIGHIRGAVLWRAGRKEEAIQVLKSVLPRADSILERFDVLYELFRALGTRESAEQALEAGIVLQQDNPHWETGSKIEILRATLKD